MSDPNATLDGTSSPPSPGAVEGVLAPIRETAIAPYDPGAAPPGSRMATDFTEGGIDYVRLLHALRRRWLPAVALGALVGILAGLATWLFMPKGYEAVAWLRVRDKSGMFVGGGRDSAEYEAYRKTQVQLIKSPFVLMSALRRPGIANLPTFADVDDPVGYLMDNVSVAMPGESEVVLVRMRGEDAKEVTQIVNAVTQAYLTDVVNKEKTERLQRRDALERKYKENMAEVRTSLDTYHNLAKTLGTSDSSEVATQRSLLLDHLGTLRAQMHNAQRDLTLIDAELAILDAKDRGELSLEQTVPEDTIDALLMRDPAFAELRQRLAAIEESLGFQTERSARGRNDPAVKRLESMRDAMTRRLEERKEELRPQIVAQLSMDSSTRRTGTAAESPVVLRMRREILSRQLEQTTKEFDRVATEVKALGAANADLMARKQEIEQLMKVTDQMGVQLNATEVDVAAPNRVELIEEASVPEGSNVWLRTMLAALAATGGLGLGMGSVVAIEYLRDRLSTADDVSQRVGLRVIGTVPRISRSQTKPNDGHVAECVDGIRAVITQTGREAPKVILVTSAMEHEGKTTFAAQLAASLARAGRRTLLLDGDLRHPNVHLALGLDAATGFPELLRGEQGIDETIQPTSIDGLFAVTGGACDYAAITALSRPETAAIMKGFRESFDHVVIDAGPVLAFADVLLLGQLSDVAIVVTMRDVSRVPLITNAVDRLRSVGIRVLGTVVNGVSNTAPRRMYASPMPT
jgi:capsular exopolysaccharide synthesis family protein